MAVEKKLIFRTSDIMMIRIYCENSECTQGYLFTPSESKSYDLPDKCAKCGMEWTMTRTESIDGGEVTFTGRVRAYDLQAVEAILLLMGGNNSPVRVEFEVDAPDD